MEAKFRLPKDIDRAIDVAKDILKYKTARGEKTQAKISVKKDDHEHETSFIYLRKEAPEKVELLKAELLQRFPNGIFDEILLRTTPLVRRQVVCPNCSQEMRSDVLTRHLKTCIKGQFCPVCQKEVTGILKKHIDSCSRRTFDCIVCGEQFNTGIKRAAHYKTCRVADSSTVVKADEGPGFSAISGLFRIVEVKPTSPSPDYEGALEDQIEHITDILEDRLETGLKFYISMELDMKRPTDESTKLVFFQTRSTAILATTNIEEEVKKHAAHLTDKIEKYLRYGSGWLVESVRKLNIMSAKYNPTKGSSFIELPAAIAKKRSLLNIKNDDNKCLLWCLLAGLHPEVKTNQNVVSSYRKFENELNMEGVSYPVTIHHLDRIERQNTLAISVFTWDEDEGFYPLRVAEVQGTHIDLLLIANDHTQHYVLIKSISGLLSNRTKHDGEIHYCRRCLHGFTKKENLEKHEDDCKKFKVQRTEMPKEEWMEFKAYNSTIMHPVFVVADFECIIEPDETGEEATKKTAHHVPCAYALKVSSQFEEWDRPVEHYRGPDAALVFILRLHEIYQELAPLIFANVKIKPVTPEEKAELEAQTDCHICLKPLIGKKHLDHCHYTGDVIAYAHPVCNQHRKTPSKLACILHSFKSYDCHLIIRQLCELEDDLWKVKVIPKNMENYTSVMTEEFRFIDSYQHLSASLDTLVKNLKDDGEDKFTATRDFVNSLDGSPNKLRLLTRKGVYPYAFMDSFEKFEEDLPPREVFFNDLSNEPCSDEDYQHVVEMWNEFNMNNLGDLCDVYVQSDVLLLADVFNQYRQECWENFQLDPLHFYTAPGLTWQAALRMTKVKLQLLREVEMYQFVESAIRGGTSLITKRWVLARNKHLPNYSSSEPSNYLWYIDANNLYGCAMVEKLPISGFDWTTISSDDIKNYNADGSIGYFVEVDLVIPNEHHEKFNCFPIAPEPLDITHEVASPKSLDIRRKRRRVVNLVEEPSDFPLLRAGQKHKLPTIGPEPKKAKIDLPFSCIKLAPNLLPKTKYICHIRNLQFYLQEGAQITKIHRALKFKQEAWLEPYISYNTEARKKATSEFKKSFHKLLNNATFGKTMESVRRRVNIVLIKDAERQQFQVSKPGFKRFQVFDDNLVGMELIKPVVTLDKPVYIGATVLDLSKLIMMEFWYKVLKVKYPTCTLCFTDTDSFLIDIPTDDLYQDLEELKDCLDLSNYPKNHPLFDPKNKAVLGKFKDETAGNVIQEFVGLRSKCYSLTTWEGESDKRVLKQKSTAAGVKKAVQVSLNHEMYKSTLINETDCYITQNLLRSYNHTIHSVTQTKVGLTAYDDKRYLLKDSITTRAHGHYLNE